MTFLFTKILGIVFFILQAILLFLDTFIGLIERKYDAKRVYKVMLVINLISVLSGSIALFLIHTHILKGVVYFFIALLITFSLMTIFFYKQSKINFNK
jgi:hypothetical protein